MEEVSVFGDPDESKAKMRAQFKKEIKYVFIIGLQPDGIVY